MSEQLQALQADKAGLQAQVQALGQAQQELAQELEDAVLQRDSALGQVAGLEAAKAAVEAQMSQHGDAAAQSAQQVHGLPIMAQLTDTCLSSMCDGDGAHHSDVYMCGLYSDPPHGQQ